jgi:hypothetical protein
MKILLYQLAGVHNREESVQLGVVLSSGCGLIK